MITSSSLIMLPIRVGLKAAAVKSTKARRAGSFLVSVLAIHYAECSALELVHRGGCTCVAAAAKNDPFMLSDGSYSVKRYCPMCTP